MSRNGKRRRSMSRTRWVLVGASMTASLATTVLTGPASAAVDNTPPTLNLPAYASFTVGGTTSDSGPPTDEGSYWVDSIPMRFSWTASDASGICGYDIWEVAGDGES